MKGGEENMTQGQGQHKSTGQGFASMSEEQKKEIASKGGRAAHDQGTAHEWTSEEASEAAKSKNG